MKVDALALEDEGADAVLWRWLVGGCWNEGVGLGDGDGRTGLTWDLDTVLRAVKGIFVGD